MKKLLTALCLFASIAVFSQDTTRISYILDKAMPGAKRSGVQDYLIDGFRAVAFAGDTIWNLNNGRWELRNGGVFGNGNTSASSRLNTFLSLPFVSEITANYDTATTITLTANITGQGKTLHLPRGAKFTGSYTISNLYMTFPRDAHVFDTSITLANVRTQGMTLTPFNVGAKADGVTNDFRFMYHAMRLSAANRLKLDCSNMRMNFGTGIIPLMKNVHIDGGNSAQFLFGVGGRFTQMFQRCDSMILENYEIIKSGTQAITQAYHHDLRSQTGNKSVGSIMRNVAIKAHRVDGFPVRVGNHSSLLIDNVHVDSSTTISIFVDSSDHVTVQNCKLFANGRSGINFHSHNKNFKAVKNTIIGIQQFENFADGAVDVYGDQNDGGLIAHNYIDVGNIRVNSTPDQIGIRIKGSFNIDAHTNRIISNSDYCNKLIEVSNRNTSVCRNVNVYNNSLEVNGGAFKYGIFFGGTEGPIKFSGNTLNVDPSVTVTGASAAIQTTYRLATDTIQYADFTANNFNFGGKLIHVLDNYNNLLYANFSNTTVVESPQVFSINRGGAIRNVTWIGGKIKSLTNNAFFQVTSTYKSLIASGLTITKTNGVLTARVSNDTAIIVTTGNVINDELANADGGGQPNPQAVTTPASSYTVTDFDGVVYASGAANQTITLQSKPARKNALITISKTGGSAGVYALVVGAIRMDTVYYGSTVTYHFVNNEWRPLSSPGFDLKTPGHIMYTTPSGYDTINAITYDKAVGNVGIGRAPTSGIKMDVLGRTRIQYNGYGTIYRRLADGNNLGIEFQSSAGSTIGYIMAPTDTTFDFGAGLSTGMRIRPRLGLGTQFRNDAALTLLGSTADQASIFFLNGVAPTTPLSGMMWREIGALNYRDGTTTYNLLAPGGGGSVGNVGSGTPLVKSPSEIKTIGSDSTLIRTNNVDDISLRVNENLVTSANYLNKGHAPTDTIVASGDSRTGTSYATAPWPVKIGNYFGLPVKNYAVDGSGVRRSYSLMVQNYGPKNITGPLFAHVGFNNVRTLTDTSTYIEVVRAGFRALTALWYTDTSQFYIMGNLGSQNPNVTLSHSGSGATATHADSLKEWMSRAWWTAYNDPNNQSVNYYKKGSLNPSEYIQFSNIKGTDIAIHTWKVVSARNWSSFNVTVDGVLHGTFNPDLPSSYPGTDGGINNGIFPDAYIISGLRDTLHTVRITWTESGRPGGIDCISTLKSRYRTESTPMYVFDIPYMKANGYNLPGGQTTQAILDSTTSTRWRTLTTNFPGYPFVKVPTNRNLDTTTMMNSDGIHDNGLGHENIAKNVIFVTNPKPVSGRSGGSITINNPGGSDTTGLDGVLQKSNTTSRDIVATYATATARGFLLNNTSPNAGASSYVAVGTNGNYLGVQAYGPADVANPLTGMIYTQSGITGGLKLVTQANAPIGFYVNSNTLNNRRLSIGTDSIVVSAPLSLGGYYTPRSLYRHGDLNIGSYSDANSYLTANAQIESGTWKFVGAGRASVFNVSKTGEWFLGVSTASGSAGGNITWRTGLYQSPGGYIGLGTTTVPWTTSIGTRLGLNKDSIPEATLLGALQLLAEDTATGQVKRILPSNLGISGGGGGGETNTASNYGVGGVGLYNDKSGVDLRFRNLNAGSNKVTITLDAGNREVDIDVNPANFTGIPQAGVTGLTTALNAKANTADLPELAEGFGVRLYPSGGSLYVANRDTGNVWTPTVGTNTNIASYTLYHSTFSRNNNIVTFSFMYNVTPSTVAACELQLSLPIPSTFTNLTDGHGNLGINTAGNHTVGGINSTSSGTSYLRVGWTATATSGQWLIGNGQYEIK